MFVIDKSIVRLFRLSEGRSFEEFCSSLGLNEVVDSAL